MQNFKKIVLKIGSSLISENKSLSYKRIKELSEQVVKIIKTGKEFIIVTSGAISQGQNLLNIKNKPKDLDSLQALAAIGQQQLMGMYENSFSNFDVLTAQVLLTHDDMNNADRYLNAKATIGKILKLGVIPIINENDVVATDEIKFGDNDTLAAMVANLVGADLMIILTDQNGFFDKNPDLNKDATLIKKCNIAEIEVSDYDSNSKSKFGTGGFTTKIKAVKVAAKSGTTSIVASGYTKDVLNKIFDGEEIGTIFLPNKK